MLAHAVRLLAQRTKVVAEGGSAAALAAALRKPEDPTEVMCALLEEADEEIFSVLQMTLTASFRSNLVCAVFRNLVNETALPSVAGSRRRLSSWDFLRSVKWENIDSKEIYNLPKVLIHYNFQHLLFDNLQCY